MLRWSPVFCLLLAVAGCANPTSEGGPAPGKAASALRSGAATTGDPAVVALLTKGQMSCSGTLIGPRAVLGAAHCFVDDLGNKRAIDQVRIGSANATDGGTLVGVAAATVHPEFHREDDGTLVHDVAILMLAAPATAVAPAELLPAGTELKADQLVRLVGFGYDGETTETLGVKRTGKARIAAVESDSFNIVPDPAIICSGDSGGPALVAVGTKEYVAGVASYGDGTCEVYGVEARVDTNRAFIDAATKLANAGGPFETRQAIGAACTRDGECESLSCVGEPGGTGSFCRLPCTPDDACPAGAGECRITDRTPTPYACFATPAPPLPGNEVPPEPAAAPKAAPADASTGCATSSGPPSNSAPWLGALGLVLLLRRRRCAQ